MLTISRLSRWSIAYYEKTADEAKQAAMDRQAAGGGLGEYYGEGDTRAPTWNRGRGRRPGGRVDRTQRCRGRQRICPGG